MNYSKIFVFILIVSLTLNSKLWCKSDTIILEQGATKRVFVPHEDIGDDWKTDINFDDSSWSLCEGLPGGVGYEKSSGYEDFISLDVGNEMHDDGENPNTGCYIRIPFTIDQETIDKTKVLKLRIKYDDGFIAYLNGHECMKMNASRFVSWNYASAVSSEATSMVPFDISNYIRYLNPGENFLAIHGVNTGTNSSDFLILPELVGGEHQYEGFDAGQLPIFLIDTDDKYIEDEPKIDAEMKIIYHEDGTLNHPGDSVSYYNGNIGIEVRGAYSATFPQKPYSIETRTETGENDNVSLVGLPKENDWLLIPNYNDKSFVRNSLSFEMFRQMGHYAPRTKLCEVFINQTFRGMYLFTEKIKRDKNRVDISKLKPEDISGDDLTGGYLFKIDYYDYDEIWLSDFSPIEHPDNNVYFVYHDPNTEELIDSQKDYIQNFMRNAEGALYGDEFADPNVGYHKYFDVNSFIDYFIVSEVSRNVDGYKKSRYFHKNKDSKNGLLHAGPVWDFDWAWKNISGDTFGVKDGSGWSYSYYPCWPSPPYWYTRFLQDAKFTNQLIDRYTYLRTNILDLNTIDSYIDSVVTLVEDCKDRHFELWPINQGYMTPETDSKSHTYEEEIDKLKNWIHTRIAWLDDNIPLLKEKITTSIEENDQNVLNKFQLMCYPNPFNPSTTILFSLEKEGKIDLRVYNIQGKEVWSNDDSMEYGSGNHHVLWNAIDGYGNSLSSGIYYIKLITRDKIALQKVILMK